MVGTKRALFVVPKKVLEEETSVVGLIVVLPNNCIL